MKICAVICEYNPFHNGHKYQLGEIRRLSGCDTVLCLMSGDFTQRGEIAVLDKFTRARHAVENGADAVLELPVSFSVAPAELFASGAVHILSSSPAVACLAFGCESGTKADFLAAAKASLCEDKPFKALLKENMKSGASYVKARTETLLALNRDLDGSLFSSPNNILGVEYCRALLAQGSAIEPLPIPRVGGGYADERLFAEFSSAAAIRAALLSNSRKEKRLLKENLPAGVLGDLESYCPTSFKTATLLAMLSKTPEEIARCTDCSEGLENRLRAAIRSCPDYDAVLEKVVSKRYTLSRIKRLLAQNFLSLSKKETLEALRSPLYYRALCVKAEKKEALFSALSQGAFPLLARKSDVSLLKRAALNCHEIDLRAGDLFNILSKISVNPHETLFV